MKEEIADSKENLDTLTNRPQPKEKILKMEGKICFFSGSGANNWTAGVVVLVMFRVVCKYKTFY